MTSDGVEASDWDRVHYLALAVANASSAGDDVAGERAQIQLIAALDELDLKYGPKPSLLATRADYVESSKVRQRLLRTAYDLALRIRDDRNVELIAHSLAAFYLEEVGDIGQGASWLGIWRNRLGLGASEDDQAEFMRLEELMSDQGTG